MKLSSLCAILPGNEKSARRKSTGTQSSMRIFLILEELSIVAETIIKGILDIFIGIGFQE